MRVSSVALALQPQPAIVHAGTPSSARFERKRRAKDKREGRALKKRVRPLQIARASDRG